MARQGKTPQPSPLQMLAILRARAEGMSYHQIAKRTGHGAMSPLRWFDAWGHDAKTFDNWVREFEVDISGHTFDDYYPPPDKPLPTPFIQRGEKRAPTYRFPTRLGLK
jgi:hypothetical protein